MREIEFKGKRLNNKEWVHGFYYNETSRESHSSERKVTRHHIYTQNFNVFVDPETVGEYTGTNDVKGKKIFEGDIVEVTCKYKGNVEFEECGVVEHTGSAFELKIFTSEEEFNFPIFESVSNDEREDTFIVIGNKYDNPELLEGV